MLTRLQNLFRPPKSASASEPLESNFRAEIELAQTLIDERRLSEAATLLAGMYRKYGPRPGVIRRAARIAVLRRRLRFASSLIDQLAEIEEIGISGELIHARYHLSQGDFEKAGEALSRARTAGANGAAVQRLEGRTLRGQGIMGGLRQQPEFRHIAIGGVSFTGSTLLSSLLGSMPGIANIGESLHLIDKVDLSFESATPQSAVAKGRFDWSNDDHGHLFPCVRCGPQCDVFDNAFRRGLADDPAADWYGRIADRLQATTLVSSDKNAAILLDHDPCRRFDLIVVFKSPGGAWRSTLKFMDRVRRSNAERKILKYDAFSYLNVWSENYLSLLHEVRGTGRFVCLNWEEFERSPHAHFAMLCQLLRLPADPEIFDNIATDHHAFGGNPELRPANPGSPVSIKIRSSNAAPLSPLEQQHVAEHKEARFVFRQLMAHYHRHFGNLKESD